LSTARQRAALDDLLRRVRAATEVEADSLIGSLAPGTADAQQQALHGTPQTSQVAVVSPASARQRPT
jgi:hypothetical protein